MNSRDPLAPYRNLFITARPGMGATTLALNIVSKYLDEDKKCLVFENTNCFSTGYIERTRALREGIGIDSTPPLFKKYGNLTVAHRYLFELDTVLSVITEHNPDIIVYEESHYSGDQSKDLIRLVGELKKMGKLFIFVTHLKRKRNFFTNYEYNAPFASRHRKAIPYFDATAIVYRNGYCDEVENVIEEIRIYERGKRKYRTVPVRFDFQKQRIILR